MTNESEAKAVLLLLLFSRTLCVRILMSINLSLSVFVVVYVFRIIWGRHQKTEGVRLDVCECRDAYVRVCLYRQKDNGISLAKVVCSARAYCVE